jgi:uncharacterized protein (TIGR03083 family)
MTLPLVDTMDLFVAERRELLDLLNVLTPTDWLAPTACAGWSVHDVALHLLGGDLSLLSRLRDNYSYEGFGSGFDISTLPGLVAAVDRNNARWVDGMRRLSPRLLMDLLRFSGEETAAYVRGLDLNVLGGPVDWAGPEPAGLWLHIAREYTERWHHQQHIRDAVGRPGLKEPKWLAPVLQTFVLGLLRRLRVRNDPQGTVLKLTIVGASGGEWFAIQSDRGWTLKRNSLSPPNAEVQIEEELAWRLFTRGVTRDEAKERAIIAGDTALASVVFDTVSILA